MIFLGTFKKKLMKKNNHHQCSKENKKNNHHQCSKENKKMMDNYKANQLLLKVKFIKEKINLNKDIEIITIAKQETEIIDIMNHKKYKIVVIFKIRKECINLKRKIFMYPICFNHKKFKQVTTTTKNIYMLLNNNKEMTI